MTGLALPLVGPDHLRRRVDALAENRPGIYRMVDATGRVVYVGKAKRIRTRLLSYFRAQSARDKAARILGATHEIAWEYAPSEFAAYLAELRQIRRYRPPFNVRMNRPSRVAFIKVSSGPAPKIYTGSAPSDADVRHYGPYRAGITLTEAVRALNLELGLRDCSLRMPMVFSEQGDLFARGRRAACLRYEIGTCLGPCGGFVTQADYQARIDVAIAFLEGRGVAPLDQVIEAMTRASDAAAYERAARWRDRYDALEWLFAAGNRIRAAIEALTFVYLDPGVYGDDRIYVIRHATVRASAPAPRTPIERAAFRSVVAEHAAAGDPPSAPLEPEAIDETVLLLSWFRRHPAALRRTVPLEEWAIEDDQGRPGTTPEPRRL